jgi:Tol biopolymer transport system component
MFKMTRIRVGLLAAGALGLAAPSIAKQWGEWGFPLSAESLPGSSSEVNTAFNDGCPIQAPDGLSLYMASNRPGGLGGQDIWVAHRSNTDEGWGPPENLGAPVNSAADDFCPDPVRGDRLFFVSRRDEPNGDIYLTRFKDGVWQAPESLGPIVNSPAQEWSPSYYEDDDGHSVLYFGSTRAGGLGGQDIYYSVDFAPPQAAVGLNTNFDDARPNVSKDGRSIVFDSTRPGTLGGPDIWTATRDSTADGWSNLTHLDVNSTAADTRASFSWDGSTIVFGSARAGGEGMADIFVTTRFKQTGKD